MKTSTKIRQLAACVIMLLLTAACASKNGFYGSAHDRTGTNGATNGNGKAPPNTAHSVKY